MILGKFSEFNSNAHQTAKACPYASVSNPLVSVMDGAAWRTSTKALRCLGERKLKVGRVLPTGCLPDVDASPHLAPSIAGFTDNCD
jgi:hypothetical protein